MSDRTAGDRRRALWRAVVATRPRWRRVGVSIALGTGAVIAAGALLAISGYLISRAAQQPPILLLTMAIVGVRFFGITRAVLRYLERLVSHDVAFRTLTDLRVRFFRKLVPLVPAAEGARGGELLSRFVGDVDRLQDLYLRALSPPLVALAAGAVGVLAAVLMLPSAGLVIAGVLVGGGVAAPALIKAVARRSGRRQAGARAALTTDMVEIVGGAPEIAVAGREADWERRAGESSARLGSVLRRDSVASGLAVGTQTAIAAGAAVAMAAVAIPAVDDGALAGVLLAALVLLAMASIEAVAPLGAAAASIDAVGDAALRVEEVTERPPPVAEPSEPSPVPDHGRLSMRGVTFGYGDEPDLFEGVSLELAPGEAVALVGASGTGKTTIAELLVRFRDPRAGRVELGGTDLRRLDPDALRQVVRLAPQDAYLFATTIRANLALANPEAGDDGLMQALGRVGLREWAEGLPAGLETEVGESGAQVSGGQRQRIAAARAVASSARFLIFDEPTTHLDPEGAASLLTELSGLAHREGRGVLVITHERARLDGFDRVLELHGGALRGPREA